MTNLSTFIFGVIVGVLLTIVALQLSPGLKNVILKGDNKKIIEQFDVEPCFTAPTPTPRPTFRLNPYTQSPMAYLGVQNTVNQGNIVAPIVTDSNVQQTNMQFTGHSFVKN